MQDATTVESSAQPPVDRSSTHEPSEPAQDYRFERLTPGLVAKDMRFARRAPSAGDPFPHTELISIDGNRFSVFDNNNSTHEIYDPQSRIVIVSARERTTEVAFEGTREAPFYTYIMGKHQWLPNGNVLITESLFGRGFEVNPQGEIVWQYVNKIDDDMVALVEEVTRLPVGYAGFISDQSAPATQE